MRGKKIFIPPLNINSKQDVFTLNKESIITAPNCIFRDFNIFS